MDAREEVLTVEALRGEQLGPLLGGLRVLRGHSDEVRKETWQARHFVSSFSSDRATIVIVANANPPFERGFLSEHNSAYSFLQFVAIPSSTSH
jgi:hypothetical protein